MEVIGKCYSNQISLRILHDGNNSVVLCRMRKVSYFSLLVNRVRQSALNVLQADLYALPHLNTVRLMPIRSSLHHMCIRRSTQGWVLQTSSDPQNHHPWLLVRRFAAVLHPTVVQCDHVSCSPLTKDLENEISLVAPSDELIPWSLGDRQKAFPSRCLPFDSQHHRAFTGFSASEGAREQESASCNGGAGHS